MKTLKPKALKEIEYEQTTSTNSSVNMASDTANENCMRMNTNIQEVIAQGGSFTGHVANGIGVLGATAGI